MHWTVVERHILRAGLKPTMSYSVLACIRAGLVNGKRSFGSGRPASCLRQSAVPMPTRSRHAAALPVSANVLPKSCAACCFSSQPLVTRLTASPIREHVPSTSEDMEVVDGVRSSHDVDTMRSGDDDLSTSAHDDRPMTQRHDPLVRSFNLAPFVAASPSLQRLAVLGVDMSRWERRPEVMEFVVRLRFDRDVRPHLGWLITRLKVPPEDVASLISANPLLLKEHLDDLKVRVKYLKWKRFTSDQIARIVSKNANWLSHVTKTIDGRLGFFARRFSLSSLEVRTLATKSPKLITTNLDALEANRFTIHEEFGFSRDEMKLLLINKPRLWMLARFNLHQRLHFVHNLMGIEHSRLAQSPNILMYRVWRVRQRHLMLDALQRSQYDPQKPGFVPLDDLVSLSDEQFCTQLARVPLATYHEFLKTL